MTSQLRRATISISSDIAEGFSSNTKKEKDQFYNMALGSTTEVQSQVIIAKNLEYLSWEDYKKIYAQTIRVHKLINGLRKTSSSHT